VDIGIVGVIPPDPAFPCFTFIASGATYAGYYGFEGEGYETTSFSYTSFTFNNVVSGQAFGITLAWQNTDLITPTTVTSPSTTHFVGSTLSAALITPPMSSSTVLTQTYPVVNNAQPASSHQISLGVKIGMGVAIPVLVFLLISIGFFFFRRKRQPDITDERQEYRKPELEANSSTLTELPDSHEIRELDSTPISTKQVQGKKPIPNQVAVFPSDFGVNITVEGTGRDVKVK
jgi:hypothetical protein